MAVASITATHGRPIRLNQAGLWFFFLSETFLFAALLSARFYIAGFKQEEHVDQGLGLAITTILIVSSFTAFMSESSMARGDRRGFFVYLVLTVLLGVVFVGGVAVEWSTAHFTISEPFGTAFFSMTGLHASHVVSGILILLLVLNLGRQGRFSAESHWGVEAAVKYWHFVDVVWVFFYPALYLINW